MEHYKHHHSHTCDKHKKCCEKGERGPRGHRGEQGPPFAVDYVRATSDVSTNSRVAKTIDYYSSEGTLTSSLDNTTGIFTSPSDSLYLVTLNVTFQNFGGPGGGILVDSGNRSIKVDRFNYLIPEPAFIGQNISVVNPLDQSGEFYALFNTKLSASGVFPIPAGKKIHVVIYQDNPDERAITAFSELSIVKLKDLSDVALMTASLSGFKLQGI